MLRYLVIDRTVGDIREISTEELEANRERYSVISIGGVADVPREAKSLQAESQVYRADGPGVESEAERPSPQGMED